MSIRDNLGGGSAGSVLDTLEEIAANTEAGKAAGALAVKELNGSLKWKYLASVNGLTNRVDISNIEAKEFLCVVQCNNVVFEIHIFKSNLTETNKEYRAGWYQSGNGYGSTRIDATINSLKVGNFNIGGTVYEDNSISLTVYYR